MKRVMLAIAVGLTVFGLVFGAAATLGVNTAQMASGESLQVSGCDAAVSVSFGLSAGDISSVSAVTVSDINTDAATGCVGETLSVEVTDGTTVRTGSGAVGGATETVTLDGTLPAADVTFVTVTITG